MKKLGGRTIFSLSLAVVTFAGPASSDSPPAGARFAPNVTSEVAVPEHGSISISEGVGATPRVFSTQDLANKAVSCPGPGDVGVRSDPRTQFWRFMYVAAWLQDCGFYHLDMVGRVDGGRDVDVKLVVPRASAVGVPPAADVVFTTCEPSPASGSPKCSSVLFFKHEGPPIQPTMVELADNGQIDVFNGRYKRLSTLDRLVRDVRASLGSFRGGEGRVYVRANPRANCSRFLAMVDRLRRDGYSDVALIVEGPGPPRN